MIPPLPTDQGGSTIRARHMWIMMYPRREYQADEVRQKFMDLFNRKPDRCYSPEESATEMWWLGWVTKQESRKWVEQKGDEHDKQTMA